MSEILKVQYSVSSGQVDTTHVTVTFSNGVVRRGVVISTEDPTYALVEAWIAESADNKIEQPDLDFATAQSVLLLQLKLKKAEVESVLSNTIRVNYLNTTFKANDRALLESGKVYNEVVRCQEVVDSTNPEGSQSLKDEYSEILSMLLPLNEGQARLWTDVNGVPQVLQFSELTHFYNKVSEIHLVRVPDRGERIYRKYFELRSAISSATTISDLSAISFDELESLKDLIIDI